MNVKSSNQRGDNLVVSCGNEDDSQIKIWSLKDQTNIARYNPSQYVEGRRPYYYINVIYLNMPKGAEPDPDEHDDRDEQDPVEKGFVIIAASIKNVDAYFKSPMSTHWNMKSLDTQDDIGSYLSSMTTVKHDDYQLTCLVGNVSGVVEMYSIKFDKQELQDGSFEIDQQSLDSDNSKRDEDDSKKEKENRIKIESDVDIKELIERRRNGNFSDLESKDESKQEGQVLPDANGNILEIDEDGKQIIGQRDEGGGELSHIIEDGHNISLKEEDNDDKVI